MMPGMNGVEVMNTLFDQNTNCSIVLMSGSEDRLERAEAIAKKLCVKLLGVLNKPFQLADVQKVLAAY